jgi:hypothetical protein
MIPARGAGSARRAGCSGSIGNSGAVGTIPIDAAKTAIDSRSSATNATTPSVNRRRRRPLAS